MVGIKVYCIFLIIVVSICNKVDSLKLRRVLMLSRHNIRTPLTGNLDKISPRKWPKWDGNIGELTRKGATLEEYMGEYFSAWLMKEELLQSDCPDDKNVYVYANTKQRTKESARSFVRGAFRNCNVTVHHKNIEAMDPVFNPIISNDSNAFKTLVVGDMQRKIDHLELKEAFSDLNDIIDYKNSVNCKIHKYCDLATDKNDIVFEVGEEPNLSGPLSFGNSAVDAFIMAYYDGMPSYDVAWGKINTSEQWTLFMGICQENHNIRFNNTILAKNAARLLLKYINDTFLNESAPKFTSLFGHDSNIVTVTTALGFKPFELPDQYEKTPIGGKIIFQNWYDENTSENFLKVDYVYQTTDQLRNGIKLSLENPPKWVIMEIDACKINDKGFCNWNDFIKIFENV